MEKGHALLIKAMMTSFRAKVCGALVALIFSIPAAQACCRVSFSAGPVHVDTGHPLQPVKIDPVKVPGGQITPPAPGLVPTTPSVQLDKDMPGAAILNKTDDIAHAPEREAQNGLNAAGAGVQHLGNEIGMFWVHLKQNLFKLLDDGAGWLLKLMLVAVLGMSLLVGFLRSIGVLVRAVTGRRRHA